MTKPYLDTCNDHSRLHRSRINHASSATAVYSTSPAAPLQQQAPHRILFLGSEHQYLTGFVECFEPPKNSMKGPQRSSERLNRNNSVSQGKQEILTNFDCTSTAPEGRDVLRIKISFSIWLDTQNIVFGVFREAFFVVSPVTINSLSIRVSSRLAPRLAWVAH